MVSRSPATPIEQAHRIELSHRNHRETIILFFQRTMLPSLLLLALTGGCGKGLDTVAVRGVVTLDDGAPLVGATVSMESIDHAVSATGQTDAEGRFAMGALAPGGGMPRGTYRAAVSPPADTDPDRPQPMPFDSKYTRYETSGLQFEITGPTDSLVLALK